MMNKIVFKKKMRSFISICLLFFVLFPAAAQEQAPLDDLNQFVIENLQFPKGELSDGNKGRMILSLKINNEGLPDSVFVSQASTETFNAECMRVMELIIQNWRPSFLDDRAAGEEYLLVFSFSAQMGNSGFSDKYAQLERLIKKEKYEKAMALIDQKIEENPFYSDDYLTRSEIHRQMGNNEESQRDYMTARQLKKKILVNAEVTAFGMPRPPSSP